MGRKCYYIVEFISCCEYKTAYIVYILVDIEDFKGCILKTKANRIIILYSLFFHHAKAWYHSWLAMVQKNHDSLSMIHWTIHNFPRLIMFHDERSIACNGAGKKQAAVKKLFEVYQQKLGFVFGTLTNAYFGPGGVCLPK